MEWSWSNPASTGQRQVWSPKNRETLEQSHELQCRRTNCFIRNPDNLTLWIWDFSSRLFSSFCTMRVGRYNSALRKSNVVFLPWPFNMMFLPLEKVDSKTTYESSQVMKCAVTRQAFQHVCTSIGCTLIVHGLPEQNSYQNQPGVLTTLHLGCSVL